MSDRIQVQVQFRKALWVCVCGQEDITNLNVGTPSVISIASASAVTSMVSLSYWDNDAV
jgi:hypothetical protein